VVTIHVLQNENPQFSLKQQGRNKAIRLLKSKKCLIQFKKNQLTYA